MDDSIAQPGEDLSVKRVFTTGEAAEVCKVSQQTIIRCFDTGRLSGFRVPGSKFRRIPREELIRFMKANNIPLDALEGGRKRVLIVDDDIQVLEAVAALLSSDSRLEVRTANTGYDAGMLTEHFRPQLLVIDYQLPDLSGAMVCRRIRENSRFEGMRILCISAVAAEQDIRTILEAGADAFLRKPFDHSALLGKAAELLQLRPA